MDSDGSHPPSFIKEIFAQKDESRIVIASRYIKGGHTENSKALILMSKLVNLGYAIVLGIKCKDISNSFKLYPGDKLKNLKLKCQNFDIVEEILYQLIKQNKSLNILEIPFTFKERMMGTTKRNLISFAFSYFFTLMRLRFF
jgi:dolichol-phosphate mannosyltransferase